MSSPERPATPHLSMIESLLAEDGIHLPRGGGAEKSINCFSPHHEDDVESMSVNTFSGSYRCHGCGISGNTYQYLTDFRLLSGADAERVLKEHGATEQYVRAVVSAAEDAQRRTRREPPSTREPWMKAEVRKDLLGDRVALYDYTDADGGPVFKVGRYEATADNKDKPIKRFYDFTPKPDGSGYWIADPRSELLKPEERIPAYPIYRLRAIAEAMRHWEGRPDAKKRGQIWVVEGEKCADLVARLRSPMRGTPLVCSLYGGTRHPIQNHDLSILYGHNVLLIADADERGRKYMRKIGRRLVEHCAEVRFVLPPGDDSYDIGDAAAGGWDAMIAFIEKVGVKSSDEALGRGKPPEHRDCLHCGKPFVFRKGQREKYGCREGYNAARRAPHHLTGAPKPDCPKDIAE